MRRLRHQLDDLEPRADGHEPCVRRHRSSTARLFATQRGYHVTEEAVKPEIAAADYDEHLALMAMDVDAIGEAVRGVREGKG
jgi:hypothetical protein